MFEMRLQRMAAVLVALLFAVAASSNGSAADPANNAAQPTWQPGQTVTLPGEIKVCLSQPVLVARRNGFLWFPTLSKLSDGRLLAIMSDYGDDHTLASTCQAAISSDGGLSWSAPFAGRYGDINLPLGDGDLLLLPYYLYPRGAGSGAPIQRLRRGASSFELQPSEVSVQGWPRPQGSIAPKLNLAGFVFNGQAVRLTDGKYLATLYGYFKDEKVFSLVGAESPDGMQWQIRSVIADVTAGLKGSGPCEAAMCRTKDGRLLCVFRNDGNKPYGQTWSSDEGRTWSKAELMEGIASVEPSLAVRRDGSIVLSGGRPGIYLWLNPAGDGKRWLPIDLVANHNASRTVDPITNPKAGGNTSSYTEVIELDDGHLLVIYDRLAIGWKAIPSDSPETNSVWVVRVKIDVAHKE